MKTGNIIWWLVMAAVCSVALASGNLAVADSSGKKTVSGSGDVVIRTREVPEFNRILLKGTGHVYLARGDLQSIEIRTDDNILPLIKTEVRDEVLEISDENYDLKPTALEFHISVKRLKGIRTIGSGDVTGQSTFEADDFSVELNGSGDMNLPIVAARLKTIINGSGSMTLTGETDDYEAAIKGSGDIRGFSLKTKNASVSIAGSGNCGLFVSESLRVDISGSGDVIYLGRPRIESRVKGSGSVKASN
jgi:hypothetical protein